MPALLVPAGVKRAFTEIQALGVSRRSVKRVLDITSSLDDESTAFLRDSKLDQSGSNWLHDVSMTIFMSISWTEKFETLDGTELEFEMCCPHKLVNLLIRENPAIRELFEQAWDACPAGPNHRWKCVYGLDECYSGNPLHESGRKTMIISFSYLQFGLKSLPLSESWFTVAVIRSIEVATIDGGYSAVVRKLLFRHFLDPCNGLSIVGTVIHLGDRVVCLFAVLWAMIVDGEGHRQVLQCSGASGIKACPWCSNVVSKVPLATGQVVHLSCSDPTRFKLHTHRSLHSEIKSLFKLELEWMARRVTKTSLKESRQAIGYAPTIHGVWGCQQIVDILRPTETIVCDWVHNLVQEGLWTRECNAYLAVSDEASEESFREFVDMLEFPKQAERPKPIRAFIKVLEQGWVGGHTRPTATEVLTFVSVVYFWVSQHTASPYRDAFLSICEIVALLQSAKFDTRSDAEVRRFGQKMLNSYGDYVRKSIAAHGEEWMPSKGHWTWHTILQWIRNGGVLLDTFVVERLHRRAKLQCRRITCTSQFERSALSLILLAHMTSNPCDRATKLSKGTKFRCSHVSPKSVRALAGKICVRSSKCIAVDSVISLHSGDFVMLRGEVCKVVEGVQCEPGNQIHLVADVCPVVSQDKPFWNIVRASDVTKSWDLSGPDVPVDMVAVAWSDIADGKFAVMPLA